MYNAQKPAPEDLPSTGRLIRSTIFAFLGAMAILFTIVLPAEYAIDPTGLGRFMGLTEMGEIKTQLQEEADKDREAGGHGQKQSSLPSRLIGLFIDSAHAQEVQKWKDEKSFTLKPGQGIEWKLKMKKGMIAQYDWSTDGGRVNYDLHGDGPRGEVSYEKGRGKKSGNGTLKAPADGLHGWFWRNRDRKNVTVILRLRGDYIELKRTY